MPSTTRGYPYPASTDNYLPRSAIQNLATAVDTDRALVDAAWLSYTPVWTSSGTAPALGNGTITGRYKQNGKTIDLVVKIVFGSTTTFGTGTYSFSIPVTANANVDRTGSAYFRDASATSIGHFTGIALLAAGGTTFVGAEATTHAIVGATTPATWVSTDNFVFCITYEAA